MWHHLPKLKIDTDPIFEWLGKEDDKEEANDFGLYSLPVPDEYLRYLKNLLYVKVDFAYVGKFEANSWFNWHCDGRRTASINVLLTASNEKQRCWMIEPNTFERYEVPYEPNIPLIFNTMNPHKIENDHPTLHRYLLTISFYDKVRNGSGFTIDDLVNFYEKGWLINESDQVQKRPKLDI
jgi:hypothetical protein